MENQVRELETRVSKNMRDGWEARTIRTEKGQTFEIITLKRYSGNLVTSITKVEAGLSRGFLIISYGMNDNFMSINHGKLRVTENVVKNAHAEALVQFNEKISTLPEIEIKNEEPEVGDIIFMDGYGQSKGCEGNNHIIYKIDHNGYSQKFHCIEKDTLVLSIKDHIRPISAKFGIGNYFEKGFNSQKFNISEDQLSNMLIEAQEVKKRDQELQRIQDEENAKKAAEKKAYLSQFQQADRRKTTNIIKQHCLKNFNISKIEVSTDVFSGGDSMDVSYFSPERIPELESFIKSFQEGRFNGMEDIYEYNDNSEIIMEGFILQTYKYTSVYFKEGEGKKQEEIKPLDEVKVEDIEIIDYSEKAIAVIGNTKPIKEELKSLGGRFNFRLSCGAGWVFPKSKREEIENLINQEYYIDFRKELLSEIV